MVEVLRKVLGWKVECDYCESVLKFHLEDMKYLNKDSQRTQYIECPVCPTKVCVRDNDFGWLNGVERIYEEKVTEEA